MQTQPTRKTPKERKKELWNKGEIDCLICPYHGADNRVGRKRRPKDDRHKNHRS